jgi:hypothetical protein
MQSHFCLEVLGSHLGRYKSEGFSSFLQFLQENVGRVRENQGMFLPFGIHYSLIRRYVKSDLLPTSFNN